MDAQADIFRDNPERLAQARREAADASRKQFPDDDARYRHYLAEAERLEKQT